MPTPSKFARATASRIVELTAAGASRREVARRIGVHHTQLQRWLERGERQRGTGTRWDRFAEAMRLAESGDPILVALRNEQDRMLGDPDLAWKFIQEREPGYERRPDPEPIKVTVVHSPFIPPVKEGA
jgi:transposase-like protein